MRKPRILRYPIDVISVATVVCALSVQVTALFLNWPWYAFFLIVILARQVNLVEHNHAHCRVFHQRFLNELLGWMCFISNGMPPEFYELHHVANHHRYNQRFDEKGQDWSSLFGFTGTRFPDKPIGRPYYVLSFLVIGGCHCLIQIARRPGSRIFWRYVRSTTIMTLLSGGLIYRDHWSFFFFFFLPWVAVVVGLGYTNYDHHFGCSMKTPYEIANVDLRIPYRFLGFNIGYHVAHHLKPGLHWSLLPHYHEAIKTHIPPEYYVVTSHPIGEGSASP